MADLKIKVIEQLQNCLLFKELSLEETRILADICQYIDKEDGQVIIEENSIGHGIYLIVKGTAEVIPGKSGFLKTIATLKPGDIFGEMSLIEDRPAASSVVAMGNTTLLKIDKTELGRLMNNNAFALKIYRSLCIVLSERLRQADIVIKEEVDLNREDVDSNG